MTASVFAWADRWRRVADLLVLLASTGTLAGHLRILGADVDLLYAGVTMDDALYYLIPAQNLIAGRGYSFDGIHLTNGVQPLWAVVTLVIAALVQDRVAAVRVLCGAGGLCWILAGALAYLAFRRRAPGAGALFAVGWLAAGTWRHLALMGMENGLQGLALASLLLFAARTAEGAAPVAPVRRFVLLGLLGGWLGLTRTEAVLAVALVGIVVWLGWFGRLAPGRRVQTRAALWYGAASAVVLGVWYAGTFAYFRELIPISGSVKMYYERIRPPLFPSAAATVDWHLWYVLEIALHGVIVTANRVAKWFANSLDVERWRTLGLWAAAGGIALAGARCLLGRPGPEARRAAVVAGACVVFAAVHLCLVATRLTHFAAYAIWYFAAEVFAVQLLLVGAAMGFLPWGKRVALQSGILAGVAAVVFALTVARSFRLPDIDPHVHTFVQAGRWFDAHVPGPQRIGAHSSGFLSYCATGHTVINLDGLINDGRYLREYLQKGRFVDYLRDERIGWYSDYAKLGSWKDGLSWGSTVPLGDMRLAKWWLMHEDEAYCVFRLWPADDALPFDPFARLQFDALALGKTKWLPAVPDDLPADELVATSVAALPSGRLHHVVMTWSDYLARAPRPEQVLPDVAADARFGDALRALGTTVEIGRRRRDTIAIVSRYWQWLGGEVTAADLAVVLRLGGTEIARGPLAQGSIRRAVPAGTVLMDAIVVALPAAVLGASHALECGVEVRGAQLPAQGRSATAAGRSWLMRLEVPR